MSSENPHNETEEKFLIGADQYETGAYTPKAPERMESKPANPSNELSSFEIFRARYADFMRGLSDAQQREMYRKAVVKQQGQEAAERLKKSLRKNH